MNNLSVINISGIDCYERDGTAYLKLDTVARGLGFTQEKGGVEYVRWETVDRYLREIGFPSKLGKEEVYPRKHLLPPCHESQERGSGGVSGENRR